MKNLNWIEAAKRLYYLGWMILGIGNVWHFIYYFDREYFSIWEEAGIVLMAIILPGIALLLIKWVYQGLTSLPESK